jgi:hypothetical protein
MTASRRRWSTSRLALLAALFAGALVAQPADAAAQGGSIETYQTAVARGARAFQNGEYPAARRYFQMGYQIHQDPVLLFNIASTYRREGKRESALRFYRRFLAEADKGDSLRALALKTVAELDSELAEIEKQEAREESRARMRAERPAGEPRVAAAAVVAERPAPEAHPGRGFKWAAAGAGACAIASFALAWRAGSQAQAAQNYLESLPADQPWDQAQAEAYQDGESANRRALLFAIAGGSLAATGVVLFTVGHLQGREASVSAAPSASGGGSVVLSGRF